MENANDQYNVIAEAIEYPVPPMNKAAYLFAQFRPWRPGLRMACQQVECLQKPAGISIRHIVPELPGAVCIDSSEIGACSGR